MSEQITKEEANTELSQILNQINDLIIKAMKLADVHGLEFDIGREVGGYGTYIGENYKDEDGYERDQGWQASDICYTD